MSKAEAVPFLRWSWSSAEEAGEGLAALAADGCTILSTSSDQTPRAATTPLQGVPHHLADLVGLGPSSIHGEWTVPHTLVSQILAQPSEQRAGWLEAVASLLPGQADQMGLARALIWQFWDERLVEAPFWLVSTDSTCLLIEFSGQREARLVADPDYVWQRITYLVVSTATSAIAALASSAGRVEVG